MKLDYLLTVVSAVVVLGMEARETNPCQLKAADIILLLDSSSSVWIADFKKILTFLKDLFDSFRIAADKIRIGLVTFTDRPRIQWTLNQHTNQDALLRALDRVQQTAGDTHTHSALKFLRSHMFTTAYGARGEDVVQIGILITDGKSRFKQLTLREAFLIHRLTNIQMFAIGIGSAADEEELIAIATKGQYETHRDVNYYKLTDFKALDHTLKTELAVKACNVVLPDNMAATSQIQSSDSTVWTVCTRRVPADIVFATDPHSLGNKQTKKMMRIVRDIVSALPVGPHQYRVAFAPHSSCAGGSASLQLGNASVYNTEHDVLRAVTDVGMSRSQLAGYMQGIRTSVLGKQESSSSREAEARRRIVVVFLDETQDAYKLETEAKKLKIHGITTLAVGIGSHVTTETLERIASRNDLVFRDTDGDPSRSTLASDIMRGICVRQHKLIV